MSEEVKVEDVTTTPEPPPAIGSIQIKDGKATVILRGGTVPFDLDYVCGEMKKRIKGLKGFYANHVRIIMGKLKTGETTAAKAAEVMKTFAADRNPAVRQLYSGLSQLLSNFNIVSMVNTKKPEEPAVAEGEFKEVVE